MSKKLSLLSCLIMIVLSFSLVEAFGSAVQGKQKIIAPGESVTFKLLFYNALENDPVVLSLTTTHPDLWDVSLTHDEITLPRVQPGDVLSGDVEYIGSTRGDIPAYPLFVHIEPPINTPAGEYEITVTATEKVKTGGIAARSERNFYFTIHITEDGHNVHAVSRPEQRPTSEEHSPLGRREEGEQSSSTIKNNPPLTDEYFFTLLMAIVILLCSVWIIVSRRRSHHLVFSYKESYEGSYSHSTFTSW